MTCDGWKQASLLISDISRAVREDTINLTDWETEFVRSMGRRLQADQPLMKRQSEVLERIWKKAMEDRE